MYSMKNYDKEHMARSYGRELSVSKKYAVEICKFIRNKNLEKAKKILQDVVDLKKAIPFTRFNKDLGHKKKIGPGKYPVKTAEQILKMFKELEANAQQKGLSTANLQIVHISAKKGSAQWRYGRKRRRRMKRTNIEIVVEEKTPKEKKKVEEKKPEEKKEEKKKGVGAKLKQAIMEKPVEKKPEIKKEPEVKKEPEQKPKEEVKEEKKEEKKEVKEEEKKPEETKPKDKSKEDDKKRSFLSPKEKETKEKR